MWKDNLVRYKKTKRFAFRVANARRNRYQQSKNKLSQMAVPLRNIADESAVDEALNQGSGRVRVGKGNRQSRWKRLSNANPNKSESSPKDQAHLYEASHPVRQMNNSVTNTDD